MGRNNDLGRRRQRKSTEGSRQTHGFSVSVSKGPEPCADILGEQFRLFHSSEMPAACHLCPTLHIEESLSPFAWGLTDILREECESGRHAGGASPLLHPLLDPIQSVCIRVIVVRQERGSNRFRYPINHDVSQEFVPGEPRFNITVAIAPAAEFFNNPPGQSR